MRESVEQYNIVPGIMHPNNIIIIGALSDAMSSFPTNNLTTNVEKGIFE